jgi:hypothetical protein
MVLLAYSIYVLIAGRFQLTPHYGVTGRGARIGGLVCLAIGLGAIQLPLTLIGISVFGSMLLSLLATLLVVPLTAMALVSIYGNAFGGLDTTTYLPGPLTGPGSREENLRIVESGSRRARRNGVVGWAIVWLWIGVMVTAPLIVVATGHDSEAAVLAVLLAGALGTVPGLLGLLALVRAGGIRGDIAVIRRALREADPAVEDGELVPAAREESAAAGAPPRPRALSAALMLLGSVSGITFLVTLVHLLAPPPVALAGATVSPLSFVVASVALAAGLVFAATFRRRWAYALHLALSLLVALYVMSGARIALAGSAAGLLWTLAAWCAVIAVIVILLGGPAREWYLGADRGREQDAVGASGP